MGSVRARLSDGVVASLALLVAMLIWGGTYVVTKEALEDVGPLTLLVARFGLAFVVLAPVAARRGFRAGDVTARRFVVFGVTGIVLHMGFENVGLQFTSAANAALIVGAIPAIAAGLSIVLLKEKVTARRAAGIALSLAGVALVAGAPVTGGHDFRWAGDLLMVGAALAWGIFTIQGKRLGGSHDALASTTAAIGSSLFFLVPLALGEMVVSGAPTVSPSSLGAVAYLGLGASAAAFVLWNFALRHVDASAAAPFVNLVPVFGVSFAALAGEAITAQQLLGGLVVGAGVILSTVSTRKREARRPEPGPAEAFEHSAA